MSSENSDYEQKRKGWHRGQTPADIQSQCLKLCSEYLGGFWREVNETQVTVRRITGGFTNQLYYCGLTSDSVPNTDVPKEVAIKLYGQKWYGTTGPATERLNDVVIGLLASNLGLGAKKYGFFTEGNIEEYIESHTFGVKDQNNPKCVQNIARMIARFHSMPVPIPKSCHWYENYLDLYYTKAYEVFPIKQMLEEINANTLLSVDLNEEIQWLKKCLKHSGSPVVFSHNDFQGRNIMIRDDNTADDCQQSMVTFCDFEFSCYYYRGFDLAAIFEEWGRTEEHSVANDVSDEIIQQFMTTYLDEMIELKGKEYALDPMNTVSQLVREAEVFLLTEHMYVIVFILRTEDIPNNYKNKEEFMKIAEKRMKQYLTVKDRCIRKGYISKF